MFKFNIGDIVLNCNREYVITKRYIDCDRNMYDVKRYNESHIYTNNAESAFTFLKKGKKNNYHLK